MLDRHDDVLRHSLVIQHHHAISTALSRRQFLSSLAVGLPLLGLAPDVLAASLEAASSMRAGSRSPGCTALVKDRLTGASVAASAR